LKQIRTASIATLGCKLNQSESDQMARCLEQAGVILVPFGQPADLCVVNSCTVTHIGDRKSRQLIRQAVRANPEAFVVVAGCYAEMEAETVSAIEGVGAVLSNREKDRLVEALRGRELTVGKDADLTPPAPLPDTGRGEKVPLSPRERARVRGQSGCCPSSPHPDPLPLGEGVLASPSPRGGGGRGVGSVPRTRAFVKIQEGCDNYCSYCIVPHARGHRRSRPAADVLAEIRALTAEGRQEVVLTGVNITTYGRDHSSDPTDQSDQTDSTVRGLGLLRLIKRILAETEIPRIRLSSLQPEDWSPSFYPLWDSGRLCRHLHLSLQSGCGSVLKRMRRRYNVEQYARIVVEAKQALPGVAITTDVIVGFPGETEDEYRQTEEFLRSVGMAGFHVFKYSPRAGTPAATMPEQVDPKVKQLRSDRLIALAKECGERFRAQFVGAQLSVLWEEPLPHGDARKLDLPSSDRPRWSGLSDNYVRVYATGLDGLAGQITSARVVRLAGEGVVASIGGEYGLHLR